MSNVSAAIGVAKFASTFVVASGAGTLISTATKLTLPIVAAGKFGAYKKLSVTLGAFALGGMTAKATSEYLHKEIDGAVEMAGFVVGGVADASEALANKVHDVKVKKTEGNPNHSGASFLK